MDAAVKDPRADAYDAVIRTELADYQARLGLTQGWQPLPAKLLKAMILVESGGPAAAAWLSVPARIGASARDPGYRILKGGQEWSSVVMSADLSRAIAQRPITEPTQNVRAAIALVLTKAVRVMLVSSVDPADPQLHRHITTRGDSFDRMRQTERTTIGDLKTSNPGIKPSALHPGQSVGFHHASMQPRVIGWQSITAMFLAQKYNGGGDPAYAGKLAYVLKLLP